MVLWIRFQNGSTFFCSWSEVSIARRHEFSLIGHKTLYLLIHPGLEHLKDLFEPEKKTLCQVQKMSEMWYSTVMDGIWYGVPSKWGHLPMDAKLIPIVQTRSLDTLPTVSVKQCCGSAFASMQIQIQHFTSMRIQIQEAKPMRIHPDPDPGQTLL